MTKQEKIKLNAILQKMAEEGMVEYNSRFFGKMEGYELTREEYEFISPFFAMEQKSEYTVGDLVLSSDSMMEPGTETIGDKVYIRPHDIYWVIDLCRLVETASMMRHFTYKKIKEASEKKRQSEIRIHLPVLDDLMPGFECYVPEGEIE